MMIPLDDSTNDVVQTKLYKYIANTAIDKEGQEMRVIERKNFHIGDVISYAVPGNNLAWYGTIIHIGLGLAASRAVWIRCLDGDNKGHIECIMLENVIEVTAYASR